MAAAVAGPRGAPRYECWREYLGSEESAELSDQRHAANPRYLGSGGAEQMAGVEALETARASWPLTIYAALERLQLLPSQRGEAACDRLVLHILGADPREGASTAELAASFVPLAALLDGECGVLEVVLVGPNVPAALEGRHEVPPVSSSGQERPTLVLHLACGLFHELVAEGAGEWPAQPLASFCLNAGLWGYDSWAETLALVLGAHPGAPLVVTSYNAHEAEDDLDVLERLPAPAWNSSGQRLLSDCEDWLWLPEANPFRSLRFKAQSADSQSSLPQQDNHYWQCVSVRHGDAEGHVVAHEQLRAQAQLVLAERAGDEPPT